MHFSCVYLPLVDRRLDGDTNMCKCLSFGSTRGHVLWDLGQGAPVGLEVFTGERSVCVCVCVS